LRPLLTEEFTVFGPAARNQIDNCGKKDRFPTSLLVRADEVIE
jgi:hypothetical protein